MNNKINDELREEQEKYIEDIYKKQNQINNPYKDVVFDVNDTIINDNKPIENKKSESNNKGSRSSSNTRQTQYHKESPAGRDNHTSYTSHTSQRHTNQRNQRIEINSSKPINVSGNKKTEPGKTNVRKINHNKIEIDRITNNENANSYASNENTKLVIANENVENTYNVHKTTNQGTRQEEKRKEKQETGQNTNPQPDTNNTQNESDKGQIKANVETAEATSGGRKVQNDGLLITMKKRDYSRAKLDIKMISKQSTRFVKGAKEIAKNSLLGDAKEAVSYGEVGLHLTKVALNNNVIKRAIKSSLTNEMLAKYGTKDAAKAMQQINQKLKMAGFPPIHGTGIQLQNNAIKYKKNILKEAKKQEKVVPRAVIKACDDAKQIGVLSAFNKKTRDVKNLISSAKPLLMRQLSKCEAGEGLNVATNMSIRAASTFKRTLRIAQKILFSSRRLSQMAILAGIKQSVKVLAKQKKELEMLNLTENIWKSTGNAEKLRKRQEKLKRIVSKKEKAKKKRSTRKNKRRSRRNKRSLKNLKKKAVNYVRNRVYRIPFVGRFIKGGLEVNKGIAASLSKVMRFLSKFIKPIAAFFSIFAIIVVIYVVIIVISILFNDMDAAQSERSKIIALELRNCYENDLHYAMEKYKDCEIILSFSEIKNEDMYIQYSSLEESKPETQDETDVLLSNTEEIISMLYVLYGDEYESVSENTILNTATQLWNGSHEVVVTTESVTNENGELYTVARMNYVTDHFENLFNVDFIAGSSCPIIEVTDTNYSTIEMMLSKSAEKSINKAIKGNTYMKDYKDIISAVIQYECGIDNPTTHLSDKYYESNLLEGDAYMGTTFDENGNIVPDYKVSPKPETENEATKWFVRIMSQYLNDVSCVNANDMTGIKKALTIFHLGVDSRYIIADCETDEEIVDKAKEYIKENSLDRNPNYATEILDYFIRNTSEDITNKQAVKVLNEIKNNNYIEPDKWAMINMGARLIGYTNYSMPRRQINGPSKPNYLDCSSFTAWCFMKSEVNTHIGYAAYTGTFLSTSSFRDIPASQLQPGDIGLKNNSTTGGGSNHVGIYIGKNKDGIPLWLHCTNSNRASLTGNTSGVLISPYSNFTVFKTVVR